MTRARPAAALAAYAVVLAVLLPRLSLWLDEILTLAGARQPDLASLMEYLKTVPGGTPLAFLPPHAAIAVLGYSVFAARVTSAVASVAACAGVLVLARRLGLRFPLAAVAVFALCPLQFRYALEARPYALALCLTVWSTVVFFELLDRPRSVARILLYMLLTAAAGFTLAYALFVPLAHLAWLAVTRGSRMAAVVCAASLGVTAAALLPWYLHFRADWLLVNQQQQIAAWNWGAVQVFVKELTGAGYLGTALIAAGAVLGLRRTGVRSPWLYYAAVPILLVPVANTVFGYFFAVRQMIYVLAPLALLFVAGTESLRTRGWALLALFLVASVYEDVNWFHKPREDWQAAAQAIPAEGCVQFVPKDAELMYTYFRPELAGRKCSGGEAEVVLAISPYDPAGARASAEAAEQARGLSRQSEQTFHGPEVQMWSRRDR